VARDKQAFGDTLSWLFRYGANCQMYVDSNPIDVDAPKQPAEPSGPGMVIRWDQTFSRGEKIAHFFESDGFKVAVSHRLPDNSLPSLIWIDIGPGSPWK
jgi:hypothetical protein